MYILYPCFSDIICDGKNLANVILKNIIVNKDFFFFLAKRQESDQ